MEILLWIFASKASMFDFWSSFVDKTLQLVEITWIMFVFFLAKLIYEHKYSI